MDSQPTYIDYAEYYDTSHKLTLDHPFFLELAQRTGSPILELACGTGRILIPLLEAGHRVDGLDISENMLAICRRKLQDKGLNDCTNLYHASMAGFDLPRKDYTLTFITFRSFMHLYTQEDQLACLRSAFDHLLPGGWFVVDIYAPLFDRLAAPPDQSFKLAFEFDLPNGNRLLRKHRFVRNDIVNQINHSELRFEEYTPGGELVRARELPIDTRYTFRFELQLLLEKGGSKSRPSIRTSTKKPTTAPVRSLPSLADQILRLCYT